MNYNTLTPEQKESITPHLKGLFEERERLLGLKNGTGWFLNKENVTDEVKKQFEKIFRHSLAERNLWEVIAEIKGFQEGLKIAIKQIDEEIEWLINQRAELIYTLEFKETNFFYKRFNVKIEELKKQKEKLQFEVLLE